MTAEQIYEGKELIAKFMGGRYVRYEYLSYEPKGCWEGIALHSYASTHPQTYDLKYNSSWDWLMPVITKIYGLEDYQDYKNSTADIFIDGGVYINTSDIISTFNDAVEFIKWYNNQNK